MGINIGIKTAKICPKRCLKDILYMTSFVNDMSRTFIFGGKGEVWRVYRKRIPFDLYRKEVP
jgi:hypothetical protein